MLHFGSCSHRSQPAAAVLQVPDAIQAAPEVPAPTVVAHNNPIDAAPVATIVVSTASVLLFKAVDDGLELAMSSPIPAK
jgi:hypothetical protein